VLEKGWLAHLPCRNPGLDGVVNVSRVARLNRAVVAVDGVVVADLERFGLVRTRSGEVLGLQGEHEKDG
jgi:hypothetical protein